MERVTLEVIAPLISGAKHCSYCQVFLEDAGIDERVQREEFDSVPEEMWQEYARLSQLVRDLAQRYGAQLTISLIDPQSPMGLWKSVWHWVRRYPAFIVNGRAKYVGWDVAAVEALLRRNGAATRA